MKQVIQSRRTGTLALRDVPEPKVKGGHLLVRTRASLISAGTERMAVDFAKKSLAGKAMARPDLVKKVIGKAKRDGIGAAFKTAMARLDEPLPLGYSAAGDVVAVGQGLEGSFRVGDRVAIAGAGLANHAELNVVPGSLAAIIPGDVSDEDACFGTLGSIALHAVRNLEVGLGDVVAVIGVGLVGQLACQFLNLSGTRVLALDTNSGRRDLACELGAEAGFDPTDAGLEGSVAALTGGRGCDTVLIAAATDSSDPFHTAAAIARDRARITMVGLTGTEFPYQEFMKKELNLVVSRSYGPGRYDSDFEGRNVKYPEGWVRWTETENLAECLRLMSPGRANRLDVTALVTHRFPLDAAETAYDLVTGGSEPHLGVVLTYPEQESSAPKPSFAAAQGNGTDGCVLGVIGAGAFAKSVLLPELKKLNGVRFHTLATQRGATAEHGQQTFGFDVAAADEAAVLDNPEINTVLVATRHDSHADLTARALAAGKAVLVEKPLALDMDEINRVIEARNAVNGASGAFFQIGFNRRFAPMSVRVRDGLAESQGPALVLVRVNAGAIPGDHWVHSAEEGGGRILGEVCHFVDLARYLVGAAVVSVQADAAKPTSGACDDVTISMRFANGSLATIVYTAQGDAAAGKERIEAYCGGKSYAIDDFRHFSMSSGARQTSNSSTQDKGFQGALAAFTQAAANGGPAPVEEAELIETSVATIAVMESLRSGQRVDL